MDRTVASRFRRPRLPRVGQPRRLSQEEAAALLARPWPALPWWLWLALVVGGVGLVVAVAGLLGGSPAELPTAAARRSPPAAGLSHDVGLWQAPALRPANQGAVVRAEATCPRLAGITLVGTAEQVALLQRAAERVCALRSIGGVDAARTGLREAGAVVAFAGFERSGNESAALLNPARDGRLVLGDARTAVLVNGKFALGAPERVAVLLIHEGAHLTAAEEPGADAELRARQAERTACDLLFPPDQPDAQPNRGCLDARELLAPGPDAALAELRAAGYR